MVSDANRGWFSVLKNPFRRWKRSYRKRQKVVSLSSGEGRGNALLSYINEGIDLPDDDPYFRGHTNKWECRQIAQLLVEAGYDTDIIDFRNEWFTPSKPYDIAIDIHHNLHRLAPKLPVDCKKILHATGAYVPSLNRQEADRLAELHRRHGIACRPRRSADGASFQASLDMCDFVSLIGNKVTLGTYPSAVRHKVTCMNATASTVFERELHSWPAHREFMWFGGGGAVLKGLDLVLETFEARSDLRLNVVGGPGGERDFVRGYRRQLYETDNIVYHGFLDPSSSEFRDIAQRCVAAIKPSASEGMSTAVTTTMAVGLIPIVSRQTGIDLPTGCGIYLDALTSQCVEKAVDSVLKLTGQETSRQMGMIKEYAQEAYSRDNFRESYRQFLANVVGI